MKKTIIMTLSTLALSTAAFAGHHGDHSKKSMKDSAKTEGQKYNDQTHNKMNGQKNMNKKRYMNAKDQKLMDNANETERSASSRDLKVPMN